MGIKNRFEEILNGENLKDSFYKLISIEINEDELSDFQDFFALLIDNTVERINIYPPKKENGLDNKKNILELGDSFFRCGSLYYIPFKEEDIFYVLGDIHGDINSFRYFLENIRFFDSNEENIHIVFLGDYIDRGLYGLNVLLGILFLKIYYNEKIILLKGNHELWKENEKNKEIISTAESDNMFLEFWKDYFNMEIIRKLKNFFDILPAILILGNQIILVHGGIPRPRTRDGNLGYDYLETLNQLNQNEIIEEMLWSRPEEKDNVIITYDSPSFSFAYNQFNEFMEKIGGKVMIRSHDPFLSGFREFFGGRLISIFSTGGVSEETTYFTGFNPVFLKVTSEEINIYSILPNYPIKNIKITTLLRR